MILNTLDNLGKFEAKGDEGYFIGYSMSSKAFRVFNKRTRRVEENLHVEFLENKAIENGVGPNWLFDIDSLTKSMNYVPVDAGTNSTNLSGTKDAANQEPHDKSSSQVLKGSGNLNPSVSSSNPPADQMETLTVESPIPTVNETIGMEADVSNMETSISASPTPTLRINKDHPKSQIIGPVDTPIQTRHKSKIMEEQSFITTIHQKTDPALLHICLFSCFLSQVEPKKVSDALQDPSWVEAMQEKLIQFKIQKVWTLVDCPSGTKWVLKNKRDERGIIVRNKARLAHDDLLEFSLSKPHDESNSQIPKGSGNPNLTVSSSNPLADQMETLTVESPIATVSSPVPTAYLNDSQEPSSEARLISKRVANKKETSSLDNILSLTNRFEDTLGVTTSLDEIIRVEAD
nr:hypothetical protein [Tanacetum cinerariifolium]